METVVRIRSPTSWDYVSHPSPKLSSFHFPTLELLSHLSYRFWCSCFYLFITYISTSPGASPLSSSYLIPRYLSDALYHPGYLLSKWSRYLWRLECGSRLVGLRWDHILISVHEGLSLWSQDFWFLSLRCVCVLVSQLDLAAGATGYGILNKIQEAYQFLVHNWLPGDQILWVNFLEI